MSRPICMQIIANLTSPICGFIDKNIPLSDMNICISILLILSMLIRLCHIHCAPHRSPSRCVIELLTSTRSEVLREVLGAAHVMLTHAPVTYLTFTVRSNSTPSGARVYLPGIPSPHNHGAIILVNHRLCKLYHRPMPVHVLSNHFMLNVYIDVS